MTSVTATVKRLRVEFSAEALHREDRNGISGMPSVCRIAGHRNIA
jgi:hypothetical protein